MPGLLVDGCGVAPKPIDMKDVGVFYCKTCKSYHNFKLKKLEMKATVVWIKTATLYNKYGVYCEKCDFGYEISVDDFNRLLQNEITIRDVDNGLVFDTPSVNATSEGMASDPLPPPVVSPVETPSKLPLDARRCVQCNALLDDDAIFCAECGAKNEKEKPAPKNPCRFCQKENEEGNVFCSYCGKPMKPRYCIHCGGDVVNGKCTDCGFEP